MPEGQVSGIIHEGFLMDKEFKEIQSKRVSHCCICEKLMKGAKGPICSACTNALSIIVDGLDLYDQGLNGCDPVASVHDKLRLLIRNGWKATD